ncbi:SGNH hydrolase domain-containing protein [Methylovorus sp. SPW-M1]
MSATLRSLFFGEAHQADNYMPHIDGLRAVAVGYVLLFHAFPMMFPGGFIGVDIFFVISGYLISSIILTQLNRGKFSILDFYKRRINRIFPALILVLAATSLLAHHYLFSNEFDSFKNSLAAGAAFFANIFLYFHSDYFSASAETTPLLHLWSLGVEEQFYIVWPLVLFIFCRTKHGILSVILPILLISFVACLHYSYTNKTAAFYLPVMRFWELGAGALLACFQSKYTNLKFLKGISPLGRESISVITLGLLFASLFLIRSDMVFPGWIAIIPVTLAVAIIALGSESSVLRGLLGNPLFLFFGLISYPLYLWHWPILSMMHIELGEPSRIAKVAALMLSVVLAWGTYRFVELPLRFRVQVQSKPWFLLGSLIFLAIAVFSINQRGNEHHQQEEFLEYFASYQTTQNIKDEYRFDCSLIKDSKVFNPDISKSCYTRTKDRTIFVWGDSHAQQLLPGLRRNLDKETDLLQIASFGCAPKVITGSSDSDHLTACDRANLVTMEKIKTAHPETVILAQRRDHENSDWNLIVDYLKKNGAKKIVIVGPVPQWNQLLNRYYAKNLWASANSRTLENLNEDIKSTDTIMKSKVLPAGVVYISMFDIFCNDSGCLTYLGNDPKTGMTSWDYGHLTITASEFIAPTIMRQVEIPQVQIAASDKRMSMNSHLNKEIVTSK